MLLTIRPPNVPASLVISNVVPSNVRLDWAWATVDELPVAVRTRVAAAS